MLLEISCYAEQFPVFQSQEYLITELENPFHVMLEYEADYFAETR